MEVNGHADHQGLRTKARVPNNGQRRGSQPFTRGRLYKLLANPIYVGEISHKGERYPGEHEAIIDRQTWDGVQEQLGRNAVARRSGSNAKVPSLLAGLHVDENGERLRPSPKSRT